MYLFFIVYLNGACEDLYCKIKNRTYFFSLCSININTVLAISIVTMRYIIPVLSTPYTLL